MKLVDLLNWGVQHMELKKSTENELIGRIKEDFAEAKTIMLVSYKGITIEQDTRLRCLLREGGCKYMIYKQDLLERALLEAGHTSLAYYAGESGVGYIVGYHTSDAPEELIYQFNQPITCIKVLAASIEGRCYDGVTLQAIMDEKAERKILAQRMTTDLHMPFIYFQNVLIQLLKQKCTEEGISYTEKANKRKIGTSVSSARKSEVLAKVNGGEHSICEEEVNEISVVPTKTQYSFLESDEIEESIVEEESTIGISEYQRITEEAQKKRKAYEREQRWRIALVIVVLLFVIAFVIYTGYSAAYTTP